MSDTPTVHHTAIPRWIAVASYIVMAGAPYAVLAAIAFGGASVDDDGVHLHEWLTNALRVALLVACPAFAVGWLLWATNAARNARQVTPLAMSPFTPIVGVASMVAVVVIPPRYIEADATLNLMCVVAAVVIHLFVINSFRGTAARLGAPTHAWAQLIWVPMLITGASVALVMGAIFMDATTSAVLAVAVSGLGSLLIGIAMHRGMSSFDRAAVPRPLERTDTISMAARLFSVQPD